MMTYRGILKGPRGSIAKSYIQQLSWIYGLSLYIESKKGWFTEKIQFVVKGDDANVELFQKRLLTDIESANK